MIPGIVTGFAGLRVMRGSGKTNPYADLGRRSPSLARRVSSVVGRSPSRSAAPPVPRIRQPVLSRTLRMCSVSTSVSFSLVDRDAVWSWSAGEW